MADVNLFEQNSEVPKNLEKRLLDKIKGKTLVSLLNDENRELHYLMMQLFNLTDFEKALKSPKIFQLRKILDTLEMIKLTAFILKSLANGKC